jgi:hypothetical protein
MKPKTMWMIGGGVAVAGLLYWWWAEQQAGAAPAAAAVPVCGPGSSAVPTSMNDSGADDFCQAGQGSCYGQEGYSNPYGLSPTGNSLPVNPPAGVILTRRVRMPYRRNRQMHGLGRHRHRHPASPFQQAACACSWGTPCCSQVSFYMPCAC